MPEAPPGHPAADGHGTEIAFVPVSAGAVITAIAPASSTGPITEQGDEKHAIRGSLALHIPASPSPPGWFLVQARVDNRGLGRALGYTSLGVLNPGAVFPAFVGAWLHLVRGFEVTPQLTLRDAGLATVRRRRG